MKKRSLKKGFTLVELVVVIAVIAVLAAISVGAYFGITETANKSAALQHVKQLNNMLTIAEIMDGNRKNETFHETRVEVEQQGLNVLNLKEFGNYKYAWNSDENRFYLVDIEKSSNIDGVAVVSQSGESVYSNKSKFFLLAKNSDDLSIRDFSYYLHDDFDVNSIENIDDFKIYSGFDTGKVQIPYLEYIGNHEKIIVNTRHFDTEVVVNSQSSEIWHYGCSLNVNLMKHMDGKYVENGIVGRLIVNEQSKKIELSTKSEVFYIQSEESNIINANKAYNISKNEYVCDSEQINCKYVADPSFAYLLCKSCGKPMSLKNEHNQDGEPVGYIYKDSSNFNSGCEHEVDLENTGVAMLEGKEEATLFCKKCPFIFVPTEICAHEWVVDSNSMKCIKCGLLADEPKANVVMLGTKSNPYVVETPLDFSLDNFLNDPAPSTDNFEVNTFECAYKFMAVDGYDYETKTFGGLKSEFYDLYGDYSADFIVSLSRRDETKYFADKDNPNIKYASHAQTLGLWGKYTMFLDAMLGFHSPMDMQPYQKLPLLIGATGGSVSMTYAGVIDGIQEFDCGAFNCSEENEGLILTVSLCLWEPNKDIDNLLSGSEQFDFTIGTWDYEFSAICNCKHLQQEN